MANRDYPLNAHANELCDNRGRQIAVCVVPGEAAVIAARLNRLQHLLKAKRTGATPAKYRKYVKSRIPREYPLRADGNQLFDLRGRQVLICTVPGEAGELADKLNRYQALVKERKAAKRASRAAPARASTGRVSTYGTACQSSRW